MHAIHIKFTINMAIMYTDEEYMAWLLLVPFGSTNFRALRSNGILHSSMLLEQFSMPFSYRAAAPVFLRVQFRLMFIQVTTVNHGCITFYLRRVSVGQRTIQCCYHPSPGLPRFILKGFDTNHFIPPYTITNVIASDLIIGCSLAPTLPLVLGTLRGSTWLTTLLDSSHYGPIRGTS